jgi:uncharacterized protein (UPF0333 family)
MGVWQIVGIVVVLVIVYVIGYYLLKESQGKLFNKARRLHRDAQESYELGDHDLADEYYAKADELRVRAQELE